MRLAGLAAKAKIVKIAMISRPARMIIVVVAQGCVLPVLGTGVVDWGAGVAAGLLAIQLN